MVGARIATQLAASVAVASAAIGLPALGNDVKSRIPTISASVKKAQVPGADAILVLVRTTLLTLNDAIATGNFSVMRDRSARTVRDGTTDGGLYAAHSTLVERKLNLSSVAILTPEITDVPSVSPDNKLVLRGIVRSEPVSVKFHLEYEYEDSRWLWSGISLGFENRGAPAQKLNGKIKTQ